MADYDWKNRHEWSIILHEGSRDNVGFVAFVALTGPIGVPCSAVRTNFNRHGWEL